MKRLLTTTVLALTLVGVATQADGLNAILHSDSFESADGYVGLTPT